LAVAVAVATAVGCVCLSCCHPRRGSAVAVVFALAFASLIPGLHKRANSQNGKPQNKVGQPGMFLAAEKNRTKHHNYHAFHHKFTTFLPPQNIQKSKNSLQKPPFLLQIFF
jgi:hypothetical protein